MTRPLKIQVSAVEASADMLGADLINAIRVFSPDTEFMGCGGLEMAQSGVASLFDIDPISVMGPAAALRAAAYAANAANQLAQQAVAEKIDAAILIDSWVFSRLTASKIRQLAPQVKIFKYVAPQVWASRPRRAETVAKFFDGVLTLFEFEPKYFEPHGMRAAFVGHSGFQRLNKSDRDGASFRTRYRLGDEALLVLAPGSRKGEIRRLTKPFRETVEYLRKTGHVFRVIIPAAPRREADIAEAFGDWEAAPIIVPATEKLAAFAAGRAALAASGTVSTELAIFGVPLVVAYRVDPLSAAWARRLVITEYASLINIAAKQAIIPEFIQEACQPERMAEALGPLLSDSPARAAQLDAFPGALEALGVAGAPAAETAAKTVLRWLDR